MPAPWKRKLPNILTLLRMLFVPFILVLLYKDSTFRGFIAAVLFILAAITDYLDGYFARKFNVVSLLGKFLDPVSDKLLVSSSLIMLSHLDRVHIFVVIILLSRDTLIGGLRSVAAAEGVIIAAGDLGKWKTAVQMVGIPALMIYGTFNHLWIHQLGSICIQISVILSMLSGLRYLKEFHKKRKLTL